MEFTCKSFQDRTYTVYLDWNVLQQAGGILQQHGIRGSLYIISDKNVFRYNKQKLLRALNGYTTHAFIVAPGESSKSLINWRRIQDFLSSRGANRRSAVIAFGGGVIGDLAGFAASTFMRGLDFIQIPTTLLSQSDSSIGAKVAVNHPLAKNLIGSFWQPKVVITDPSILQSLPRREFSAGLGEAIKYGVINDQELFERLYAGVEQLLTYNKEFLSDLIARCIKMKIRIVEEDERETGLRKVLNFGHTIGHALEQATGYKRLRHGEAVAWGMLAAGWLAIRKGMWSKGEFEKLKSIIDRAGSLYPLGNLTAAKITAALKHDKKKAGKNVSFVLPVRTGEVKIVDNVEKEDILGAIRYILSL